MNRSVARTAAQILGQGYSTGRDPGTPQPGAVQVSPGERVTSGQLGQPFAVEDEGPACGYPASGHAACASAMSCSGMGPCSALSDSASSLSRSISSWRATASVTY